MGSAAEPTAGPERWIFWAAAARRRGRSTW